MTAGPEESLGNRVTSAIDRFMQKDLTPGRTSTVGAPDFRTIPPQEARKHMKINLHDELKWFNMPGGYCLVRKAMLIFMLAIVSAPALGLFPYHSFAQEDHAPDPPAEQPAGESIDETTDDPVVVIEVPDAPGNATETIPVKEIGQSVAHLPLSIQVVYPAGIGAVPKVERLNGNDSRYTISIDAGNPDPSQSTLTFLTNSMDTWTVTVEENYDVAKIDAQYFIYIYGNNSQVWAEQAFFSGQQLKFKLQFRTSDAPHFPTPEENLAVVIGPLSDIRFDLRAVSNNLDNLGRGIVYSGNLFQGLTAVAVILVFAQFWIIKKQNDVLRQFEGSRNEFSDELDSRQRQKNKIKLQEEPEQKKRFGLFGGRK